MNGIVATILIMFLLMWGCFTCVNVETSSPGRQQTQQVQQENTETTIVAKAADGLDLKAVGELIKTVKDPEDLEKELNKPEGINNLDLNEDGQVDYIKVTEFRNEPDEYGFSLTTEPEAGEVQEIAEISIVKSGETAEVQVSGSPTVYGDHHHYHYSHSGSGATWFLMGYMLGGFRPYYSPWSYGMYPSYYRPYGVVNYNSYNSRVSNYTRTSTSQRVTTLPRKVSATNPNRGKTANSGIKAPLAKPTTTQKAFQARNPSKAVRSGGFGNKSSAGTPSSSNSQTSSGSARSKSTSRGFGGRGK